MTDRPRLRDLGLSIGRHPTGPRNTFTDVAGVRVGHSTVREGDRIRTGATAILPHGGNLFQDKTPAALAILNGFGKLAGATQIQELGEIEAPILLTNTLATGRAIEASVNWTLSQPGNERVTSVNAVVGETNDSRLNDIRAGRPTVDEIAAALTAAGTGVVAEGAVGAGTGTVAFGLKGGIGTSSRVVEGWTLGVLVQSNFGGLLKIDGRAVASDPKHDRDGSIMIVVATDAPLSDRNLRRLAERAFGGLARTGAALSNGSGDYALAFSTAEALRRTPERRATLTAWPELSNDAMSPLFEAAIEATEEAILNSLLAATTTTGWNTAEARTATVPALPVPLPFLQS
ncbi:P1 family peptidase [Falsirhodobacter sp. 20TX0035]|uniref:P1 family peptidase n=1 Tax=Falsirhodobacter sp. 20TX0035 TaxID=3022019 RepID=UPI00232CAF14|nr:P1 family peptidase [Falsirhodobacter sp. 20TX0035]MDB6453600.1 P1 family peptidase [Falsirhodobacter sp. 20TX0035]